MIYICEKGECFPKQLAFGQPLITYSPTPWIQTNKLVMNFFLSLAGPEGQL